MKTSIIVPTCYRPKMFKDMLDSLKDTTIGYDIETVAVIDRDLETKAIAEEYGCKIDFANEMRGGIACWNIGLMHSTGDIIVPCGDDQRFYPYWLEYALESHEKRLNNYGMVGLNDLAYDGNAQLSTFWLYSRKFCREIFGGVIAPPVYNYYCVDSEINAKAKMLGLFYWDSRSIIEHLHCAHGKREMDRHDLYRQQHNYMEIDNKIFEDRKSRGFPIEWESVI